MTTGSIASGNRSIPNYTVLYHECVVIISIVVVNDCILLYLATV